MPDEAVFQEVVSITADQSGFAESLEELATVYQNWVSSLSEGTAGLFGAGNAFSGIFSEISTAANEIAEALNELSNQFADATEADADRAAAAAESAASRAVAADEAAAAKRIELHRDIISEIEGLEDQYAAKVEADAAKAAAADAASAAKRLETHLDIIAAIQGAEDQYAEKQDKAAAASGGGGMFGDLGSSIASVAKYLLLWQAVAEVIKTVSSIIEAPFVAIANGVQYLDQTEQSASRLVGTLAANVQYSSDLTQNFQLAAQAADGVTRKLQDAAAASGLPLQNFERIFEVLTTAGAAATVQNTDQLVQLTSMVTLFEQAAKGSDELRGVVTDLPKLLNGTLQNTSALVQATGINADQWKTIVAEAKQHGDIVEQLTPIFAPYLSAVQLASIQHANLNAQLKLQLERLEALAAEPFYAQVVDWLRQIVAWTQENQDVLKAWAAVLSDIVAQFTQAAAILGNGGIKSLVEATATGFLSALASVASIVEYLAIWSRLAVDIAEAASGGDWKDAALGVGAIVETLKGGGDAASRFKTTLLDIQKALITPTGSSADPNDVLQKPITSKGNHPSTDKPPAAKKDYKGDYDEQLATIKSFYDEARQLIQDGEANLSISKREGASAIAAVNEAEITEIEAAGQRYKDAITKFYGTAIAAGKATADDEKNALAQANAGIQNQITALRNATEQAGRGGDAEGNAVSKTQGKSNLDLIKANLAEELSLKKDAYQQGYLTASQYLDAEQAIKDRAHQAEDAAIDAEMAHISAGTERYATLVAQRKLVDAQYNAAWFENWSQRNAASEQEAQQQRQHTLTMQDLGRQQESDILGALGKTTGRDYSKEQFDLQDQSLAAQQHELELEYQLAAAKNAESEATRKLAEQLAEVNNQRTAAALKAVSSIQSSSDPEFVRNSQSVQVLQNEYARQVTQGPQSGQSIDAFNKSVAALKDQMDALTPSFEAAFEHFTNKLAGFDIKGVFDKISGDPNLTQGQKNLADFAAGLTAASNALSNIKGIVNDISNGAKQGGVAGGIGAGLTDAAKNGAGAIPGIGPFIGAIGGMLSFFGSLFTTTAQEIADNVKKAFSTTLDNYQNGNATLTQTITLLEEQRQQAISQLSGKKGGQDQLNSLLPQFDQEIAQLEIQQKQIITNFNTSLQGLQTQSDTLQQIQQQWTGIVNTVQQYLSAGGDAAAAQQYLSLQLQAMQKSSQDQLNQANDQAVQDAINLNGLLRQRLDLQQSYNQQVFSLTNQDALERTSGAVSRAEQIQTLSTQYQQQLTDLDSQISLTSQKVTLESQIFDIATDITTLHQQDAQLQFAALQEQLTGYTNLKSVISSIWQQSDGTFTSNNPLLTSNPSVVVNINGDIVGINSADPYAAGQQIGAGIAQTIQNALTNGGSALVP